jgi:hypothetical protein
MVSIVALFSGAVRATPIHYDWSGVFESGQGTLNNRAFTIGFTVPDPSVFGAEYQVDASLVIAGIGAWQQPVVFNFSDYTTTTVGLGGFTNILQSGDSLYFGICTGGQCNDPVLWNGIPDNPVLNTGTFALGLESSCRFPDECNNAIGTWFDGQGGAITTRYSGTLVVAEVPEPSTAPLLVAALAVLLAGPYPRRQGRVDATSTETLSAAKS